MMTVETELIDPPPFDICGLEQVIGTKVNDANLYKRAFTHKSASRRYNVTDSFETLEFMGDSVLGFIVTKYLLDRFSNEKEGFLTKTRIKIVKGETLAMISKKLNLHKWVLMEEKAMKQGWTRNDNVMEDVFEALVGAIYLDLGLVYAKRFVIGIPENPEFINFDTIAVDDNYKGQLMCFCQAHKLTMPAYEVQKYENGMFTVYVVVNSYIYGYGTAKIKRQAEQVAAYYGLEMLKQSATSGWGHRRAVH